ncbi:complex I NDUFA9 subunit family protein [Sphingomonas sp. ASV193]|uniref:complex I NDUFA9 subunit family protein n=1 Tax=Sphingomonas sp. ASV193 TaxID=3144405 RepID=UPI0032E8CD33
MRKSERTPTVLLIGASGFIGRYVAEQLLKAGVRVRAAERDPRKAYFLQPLGSVGQVALTGFDMARPSHFAAAVDGVDAVINLVGAFEGRLHLLHADGPGQLAEAAKKAGVSAFVQISAIGADPHADSLYGRTKGEGEARVRRAFPAATILRPSVVFGPEDQFTNRFASMASLPIVPVLAPQTKFQPVYVRDLAQAIAKAALDPATYGGKTYDIAGPEVLTMRALNERIAALAGKKADFVDLPHVAGSAMAALGFLPGAPLSRDQWAMLQHDNVAANEGLAAFGITPTALDAVAPEWLGRYRRGGRFAPTAA